MQDSPIEARRGSCLLTTDRRRLSPAEVLALLRTTYWGDSLTTEVLIRAIENSVCFGVFDAQMLIAFGRVITDLATYAYWTDAPAWCRRANGQSLACDRLRRVSLLTRDAVPLYAQ